MNEPVMRLENLHKQFGAKQVLRGIDLSLEPGTVLRLVSWCCPRPILAAELLRPLSRKQFIDSLFGASLCTFAVLWTTFNTFAVWVLWTYPGLDPSLSRITTFVFLSAALNVAMVGFGLYSPPLSIYLRMLMNFFFLIVWFTVLPWWWFARDTITDAPFWIISTLALSLGLWATRQGRQAWLDVELGRPCTSPV